MSSRQIHRLSQIQVDKARPLEVVVPVPLPPNATANSVEQDGARWVSVVLDERKRKPDSFADVRDHRRVRKLLDGMADPSITMRDGRAVTVQRKTRWLADGGSLWVKCMPSQTDPDGCSKSYVFRYSLPEQKTSANGRTYQRQRHMGLGSCYTLRLDEAREKARECRKMLLDGIDPITAKRSKAGQAKVAELRLKTWDTAVDEFLLANGDRWSKVHRRNWIQSLRDHVSPVIGDVPIHDVDTPAALRALTPLHDKHPVTCARVMNRCADVYSFAVLHGYAQEPNPWRYKGHLEFRLPQRIEVEHLPALPFAKMPSFWSRLVKVEGLASLAAQWTIANVSRTSETLQALASEVDHERQEWRVPKSHKKQRRHMDDDYFVVPLTDSAMAILAKIGRREPGERLFPLALDSGVMLDVIQSINADISCHGFRATFKTWSLECTETDPLVVKSCMSHKIGSRVDQAYHRGPQFLEKRRRHMQLWANYMAGITETADVIPMSGRRA